MPEIRRRKGKDQQNGRPMPKKKQNHVKPSGIYQSLVCLIICGVLLTGLIILYTDNIPWHMGHKAVERIASIFITPRPQHAVIIDAGSTGSRILAFTFHEALLNGQLVLDKELFVHTKPGLSTFADDPAKAITSITALIERAKAEIPREFWGTTPLVLKATAGLRLLPAAKAEGLLNAVKEYFKTEVPFMTDEHSVEIMDGTDEGIFSWFTVNFLLHNVHNPARTVAALDLGGGSTQVTFSATTPATLKQSEFIHEATLPAGTTPVYTNSYLGLGLMAARKEILTRGHGTKTALESKCVNPVIKAKKFHYGGVDYSISGLQENYPTTVRPLMKEIDPIVNYTDCSGLIKDYVLSKARPPIELSNKSIYAFSYYFDRAAESGLINEFTGGTVKLNKFKETAKVVCLEPNTEQPFMCLDLTFISVLLEDGLGLHPDANVNLYKKINGHEISWALGAAYNQLKTSKKN